MRVIATNRPVDKLNRVVLPKEAVQAAGLFPECDVDIYLDDTLIVLALANTVPICARCGSNRNIYVMPHGKHLCEKCCEFVLEQFAKP